MVATASRTASRTESNPIHVSGTAQPLPEDSKKKEKLGSRLIGSSLAGRTIDVISTPVKIASNFANKRADDLSGALKNSDGKGKIRSIYSVAMAVIKLVVAANLVVIASSGTLLAGAVVLISGTALHILSAGIRGTWAVAKWAVNFDFFKASATRVETVDIVDRSQDVPSLRSNPKNEREELITQIVDTGVKKIREESNQAQAEAIALKGTRVFLEKGTITQSEAVDIRRRIMVELFCPEEKRNGVIDSKKVQSIYDGSIEDFKKIPADQQEEGAERFVLRAIQLNNLNRAEAEYLQGLYLDYYVGAEGSVHGSDADDISLIGDTVSEGVPMNSGQLDQSTVDLKAAEKEKAKADRLAAENTKRKLVAAANDQAKDIVGTLGGVLSNQKELIKTLQESLSTFNCALQGVSLFAVLSADRPESVQKAAKVREELDENIESLKREIKNSLNEIDLNQKSTIPNADSKWNNQINDMKKLVKTNEKRIKELEKTIQEQGNSNLVLKKPKAKKPDSFEQKSTTVDLGILDTVGTNQQSDIVDIELPGDKSELATSRKGGFFLRLFGGK